MMENQRGVRRRVPRFACDAMLGGLARWLRAAGYDVTWQYGLGDDDLVRTARRSARVLVTADRGIMERSVVRRGIVSAVLVPRGLSRTGQLDFVFEALGIGPLEEPRCMACGGELKEVPKASVRAEAPPKSFARCDRFWRCRGCGKLFWRGTHWTKIAHELDRRRSRTNQKAAKGSPRGPIRRA
jgi:uncharacterized protein with PIN domain